MSGSESMQQHQQEQLLQDLLPALPYTTPDPCLSLSRPASRLPAPTCCRLLCVEHLEENSKPCLYLVFEYLSTDLKKFMDKTGKGPTNPLPVDLVKVRWLAGGGRGGAGLAGRLGCSEAGLGGCQAQHPPACVIG